MFEQCQRNKPEPKIDNNYGTTRTLQLMEERENEEH